MKIYFSGEFILITAGNLAQVFYKRLHWNINQKPVNQKPPVFKSLLTSLGAFPWIL